MNKKYVKRWILVIVSLLMRTNCVLVYGFTEIPNEELEVIVQEDEENVPSVTPMPSKGQYEYDTEKYEPKDEVDRNQNGNNQNESIQNANSQNVNNQSGNKQNVNNQSGNRQNVNNQNASNQSVNNQNVNNQNANIQNANNQNKNAQQGNVQQNNTQQETIKPSAQSRPTQIPSIKENAIIIEESAAVNNNENAQVQWKPQVLAGVQNQSVSKEKIQQRQVILKKIADIDAMLEAFARDDVLSENPRSELYDNSNYVIMSKNGEFLSITAVVFTFLILLTIGLRAVICRVKREYHEKHI